MKHAFCNGRDSETEKSSQRVLFFIILESREVAFHLFVVKCLKAAAGLECCYS